MDGEFFYTIKVSDLDITSVIKRNLQSFSIVEEDGKVTVCNMSFKAGNNMVLDKMIEGNKCEITLGYREGLSVRAYFLKVRPWEFNIERTWAFEFGVPNMSFDANGHISYSFKLHSKEVDMALIKKSKVWSNTAKGVILTQIASGYPDIVGVVPAFSQAADVYFGKESEVQKDETDFAFLQRMCKKWGAVMRLTYSSSAGGYVLSVLDFDQSTELGAYPLEWATGLKSVKTISFNPPQTAGKGGVTITPVKKNGSRTYEAKVVQPDGSVINFELNEDLIKEDMEKGGENVVLGNILAAKNFSDPNIQKYWVQVEPKVNTKKPASEETQGDGGGKRGKFGYKATIELSYGDPMFSNKYFVNFAGDTLTKRLHGEWQVSKATHNVAQGYSTTAEVYK